MARILKQLLTLSVSGSEHTGQRAWAAATSAAQVVHKMWPQGAMQQSCTDRDSSRHTGQSTNLADEDEDDEDDDDDDDDDG